MQAVVSGTTRVAQKGFLQPLDLLACPACRGGLRLDSETLACAGCGAVYRIDRGIPLLFRPHSTGDRTGDITDLVKEFYEKTPFPNYDDLDSAESLAEKANKSVFARLLDEQIPQGALVLEAGCGTGQLSNFLGMTWNRLVFASDLCLNSLRLADDFRNRCKIKYVRFVQMNLFRPAFREGLFDVVVCNGVLHHTSDPLGGFRSLARLVKPGGFIIIGLYNRLGRLPTDFRRLLFGVWGEGFRFLDSHMRSRGYNEARKEAWFMDQYKHPHESKHSYNEVMEWFEASGFEFLFSVPKIQWGTFLPDEKLLAPHDKGTKVGRFFTDLGMLLRGGADGGLFIMIGRNLKQREEAMPATGTVAAASSTRI